MKRGSKHPHTRSIRRVGRISYKREPIEEETGGKDQMTSIIAEYQNKIRLWDTPYIKKQITALRDLHPIITERFEGLDTISLLLKLERDRREEVK